MSKLVTLILRDANRTDALRTQIRRDGGRAVSLPAFKFRTLKKCPEAVEFLKEPHKFHRLFFSGPHGIASLRQIAVRNRLKLPFDMACAAPGQASLKALQTAGFTNITAPPGVADFDTLLRRNVVGSLSGKRVALVQRKDAPPRAETKLKQLKCVVKTIRCYERIINTDAFWEQLDAKVRADINCILAFDTPSLQVLLDGAGEDADRIRKLPLGVIHRNIEEKARTMGYENIIVTGHTEQMFASMKAMITTPTDA